MREQNRSENPKVSVLIPVYNGQSYLHEALDTVLAQDYENYEIVAVDDGSTDASPSILRQYLERHPELFKVHFFDKNRGMDHALNYGLDEMVSGKYIARFNQDDLMPRSRLSKQVEYMEAHPECAGIGGQVDWINDDGEIFDHVKFAQSDEEIRALWSYLSPYDDPAVMYRFDMWKATGGYDQDFWPADDVKMWYQLGHLGQLVNHPDVMNLKRWHGDAGSTRIHRLQIKNTWKVRNWARKEYSLDVALWVRLFWIGQYVSGMIMPARFNWWVYRAIKGRI